VRVIRTCQKIGFTLKDVKLVLEPHRVLASRGDASSAKSAARDKMLVSARQRLVLIDEKLFVLTRMRADMAALVGMLEGGDPMICPASRATSTTR
jgi:DNA-binding transcriptional MerR regulator